MTLARDIDVTQKSAWFMLHRLRAAATTESFNAPLDGVFEVDETFVGGNEKNNHRSKRVGGTQGGKGKTVVFGMLERDGDLRTMHTNGIESAWALLKRKIIGIYHFVSPKHLSRYLDEMTWRFNRIDQEDGDRSITLLAFADRSPVTYRELVA